MPDVAKFQFTMPLFHLMNATNLYMYDSKTNVIVKRKGEILFFACKYILSLSAHKGYV